ncbi:unnamed protein product [Rangifer tarandus platyrhynchus]|uniref:Conserved oligomeric Golgi complex subunit 2 n=1 Tax=Rangifer tarandus platyrhynchus TaxID=3082113 RepID=A0ABN8YS14_RANTA|nr:unnamed protein product [Rangifer tarandus platyrhynchus]
MEKSRMNVPKGPDTLCFDKDEFMKEDFDVDHFVSDCQKLVQLEALRDDLELYYKLLQTAMVELINKDYADFVNLSTNLVIPSVEKIEKILNSQHSKETSALEASRTWSKLRRCWSDKMFLPLLAHRLWRLTLKILAQYSIFVKESKANGETTEWEQSQVTVMLGEKRSKEQEPSFPHP